MTKFTLLLLPACFIITSGLAAAKADEEPRPVRVRILADVSAVAPGVPFEAAALLEITPGWHVYWKNPGDSGLPTSVEFSLPPGFKTDGLKWPVPSVFRGAGGLTDYGYEDSLLLSARVTPPPDLKPGTAAVITARVSWVSCKDICIPGRAELELTLPISTGARGANSDLFSMWRERLPLNYSGKAPPFEVDLKVASKKENEYSVVMLLDPKDDLGDIALYPVPGDSFIVDGIAVGPGGGGKVSVAFDVKTLPSRGPSQKELETLVVYKDKSGKRRGYELAVPIPQ